MKKTEIVKILEHSPNAVFRIGNGYHTITGFCTKGTGPRSTGATAVSTRAIRLNEDGTLFHSTHEWAYTLPQVEYAITDDIEQFISMETDRITKARKFAAQRKADTELLRDSVPVLNGLLQRHGINTHISHWNAQAEFKLSAHQIELLIQALEVGAYHSESK